MLISWLHTLALLIAGYTACTTSLERRGLGGILWIKTLSLSFLYFLSHESFSLNAGQGSFLRLPLAPVSVQRAQSKQNREGP